MTAAAAAGEVGGHGRDPGFTGWLGTVLGAPDPVGLGRFYQGLLGGELDEGDPTFVTLLVRPTDTTNLAFQLEPDHVPPAWPAGAADAADAGRTSTSG